MADPATPEFQQSSGNVFADLGFPNAEEELAKAKLILAIHAILKERGLTQTDAARLLGTTQPQVSALMRCRAGTFSVERLLRFLTALDQDIEITVKPKDAARPAARLSVRDEGQGREGPGKAQMAVKPEPVVPVRQSVSRDSITCLICGRQQKLLKRHLTDAHELTPAEYRARFGLKADYPMVAPSYAEARSKLALKPGPGRAARPAKRLTNVR
jgi:predicted transcriptional regulator/predicted XRE-type DNA-binding protein